MQHYMGDVTQEADKQVAQAAALREKVKADGETIKDLKAGLSLHTRNYTIQIKSAD